MPTCRKLIKSFIIFSLLYFWPDVCAGIFSFKICGVAPWRSGVRNIILLHTHIILSQHFTNNFSLHTTLTLDTVMNRERPTFVGFCSSIPTCVIVSSTFFTMQNREFLHCLSLLPQGKRKQGYFSGCLKMHEMLLHK